MYAHGPPKSIKKSRFRRHLVSNRDQGYHKVQKKWKTSNSQQVYFPAANYRDYGLTIRHQLAIVDKQVESLSNLEFASVVASNRGLSMRAFFDTGQAIKWLSASSNN